jgi:hypothetical protein
MEGYGSKKAVLPMVMMSFLMIMYSLILAQE